MGKSFGEALGEGETKCCQHFGRGKKLRNSNLVGVVTTKNRGLSDKEEERTITRGEGGRWDHNTR